MRIEDIEPKRTYIGGNDQQKRTVIGWGASPEFVVWSPTSNRLPYGGFVGGIRCTTRKSFAKWATAQIEGD